jgi:hypothetical protein
MKSDFITTNYGSHTDYLYENKFCIGRNQVDLVSNITFLKGELL